MDETLFDEINDSPGEIFDIPELQQQDKYDVEEFINGDIDYWCNRLPKGLGWFLVWHRPHYGRTLWP